VPDELSIWLRKSLEVPDELSIWLRKSLMAVPQMDYYKIFGVIRKK